MFKPYDQNKLFLLPPSLREWLPGDHLAHFISDVVDELDLCEIIEVYSTTDRGQPPYHPAMMVKLLLYAYCVGVPSSRKIETKTHEDIAFRFLAAGDHPDHDTIATFRKTHILALSNIFLQILTLLREAGLTKAGCISLDSTKIKANASKHKAMSYDRMHEKEKQLQREIDELLKKAEKIDREEDGHPISEKERIPEELAFRETRLKKIREAKAALERRIREEKKKDTPDSKDQINFTDSESRIMKDSSTKEFVQGYNAQCATDTSSQVIVATDVVQDTNDKRQIEPMTTRIQDNLNAAPHMLLADAGYFSEDNVSFLTSHGIDAFIPPDRIRHTEKSPGVYRGRIPKNLSMTDRMRRLLTTKRGKNIYGKRKETIEPVFGQIKEIRGFRRFLLRGLRYVKAEWSIICMTHNLLKLYRWKVAKNALCT